MKRRRRTGGGKLMAGSPNEPERKKIKIIRPLSPQFKAGCTTHPLIVGYTYVLLHNKQSLKGVLKPCKRFV